MLNVIVMVPKKAACSGTEICNYCSLINKCPFPVYIYYGDIPVEKREIFISVLLHMNEMHDKNPLALEFWTIISFGLWWTNEVILPITGNKS